MGPDFDGRQSCFTILRQNKQLHVTGSSLKHGIVIHVINVFQVSIEPEGSAPSSRESILKLLNAYVFTFVAEFTLAVPYCCSFGHPTNTAQYRTDTVRMLLRILG
jgi:hypothetical protein